ncbi:unnamed protein product [Aspergillus oryzae]|uniref:Unnamed protein product n=3 Tax=Aspergillus oryzae TaxID=5062 RepID=A0AAN4YL04_ASPOZ|nr:unnamed protein product [Aspergillus oryzae]GMF96315.1 unnamed protein product [Aspergillus oryzae]GMG16661.1 unnamed protein product [Aspergillus oryzae]GMG29790.1 unnamed protein product [Aspergillus oryzae]GMG48335.1 unnamed protein product [Aspergillus oryzae var. brunneus]
MRAFIILPLVTSILAAPTQTLVRRQPDSVIPSAPSGVNVGVKAMAAPAPSAPPQAPAPGGQSGGGSAAGGGLGDLANLIGQGVQGITKLISTIAGAAGGGGGESGGGGQSSGGGGGNLGDLTNLVGEGVKGLSSLAGAAGDAGSGLGDITSLISNAAGGLGSIGNLLGGLGGLGGLLRRDLDPDLVARAIENMELPDSDDDECIIEKLGGLLPGELNWPSFTVIGS